MMPVSSYFRIILEMFAIPGLVVIIVFVSHVATIAFLKSSNVTLTSAKNKTEENIYKCCKKNFNTIVQKHIMNITSTKKEMSKVYK